MKKRWDWALVTGASAGIGEAFARRLAEEGTNLVLVARRRKVLQELAEELGDGRDVEIEVMPADLTDPDQLRSVEARLEFDGLPIELLVNNAGGGQPSAGRFVTHDREAVEAQAVLNAISVLRLTHAAVSGMTSRRSGNVIQVSAGVAFYPVPYGATYAASKAFVNSFSRAVNHEVRRTGVSVTVVCPGFTRTEAPGRTGFTEKTIPRWLWADPEDVVQAALEAAAAGRELVSPMWVNKFAAAYGLHFPRPMMRAAGRRAKRGAESKN